MHLKRSGKRNLMLAGYFSHPVTFLDIPSDTHGTLLLRAANGCLFAAASRKPRKQRRVKNYATRNFKTADSF
jgi:hypothetical protein